MKTVKWKETWMDHWEEKALPFCKYAFYKLLANENFPKGRNYKVDIFLLEMTSNEM